MMKFTRESFTYQVDPHPDFGDQILSNGKRGYLITVQMSGQVCHQARIFSFPDGHLQGHIDQLLDNEAARFNEMARNGVFD